MLVRATTQAADEQQAKETSDIFTSLFTIYLSGTHATIEQRLGIIERLLRSGEPKQCSLGLAALDKLLEATHFTSFYRFEFGARSRNYGYAPASDEDVTNWYGAALALIERLALTDGVLKRELRGLLARNFRDLWSSVHILDELEGLSRKFAAEGFWRDGWAACRLTMRHDGGRLTPESSSRLATLESELMPSNLLEHVQATVLGGGASGFGTGDIDPEVDIATQLERLEAAARELGAAVASDEALFTELMFDLLRGGNRTWAFGRGLASASKDLRGMWARLAEGFGQLPPKQRDVRVLSGFVAEIWEQNRDLAQDLLDAAIDEPVLVAFIPMLQSAAHLDPRGIDRLKRALTSGQVPVQMYRNLAFGRTTDQVAGRDLRDLLLLILDRPDGFDVALDVLFMRLHSDSSAERQHEPELIETGRELLRRITFSENNRHEDYQLAGVARACIAGPEAGSIAAEVAGRLRQAVAAYEVSAFDYDDLLKALLSAQPAVVLDALLEENGEEHRGVFDYLSDNRPNPADAISSEALIEWCERYPDVRYSLAASFVTFARRTGRDEPKIWSEQAKALLAHAPDPRNVLAAFIRRFRPRSWSGSGAAVIEANARLLDCLEEVPEELTSFVAEARDKLARQIANERNLETETDRVRDERFE